MALDHDAVGVLEALGESEAEIFAGGGHREMVKRANEGFGEQSIGSGRSSTSRQRI